MRLLIPTFCLLASLLACNTLLAPRPEVRWDSAPGSLVISADTCCGMVYDPNGIPDAQLWGDGRLIWTEYNGPARRVLSASLTTDEMTSLVQSFVNAGFFGWQDYYSPGEPIYDAPSTCIRIALTSQSKSVCETLDGAPAKFGTLFQNLTSGAGLSAADYVPLTGYLQATLIQPPGSGTLAADWQAGATGLSLEDAKGGVWVEGETLRAAWEVVNAHPIYPVALEGEQHYTLTLLIPDLTRSAPPTP